MYIHISLPISYQYQTIFRISLQWTFNIVFIMFIHSSFFFESEIKENGKELIEDLMKETHL